MPLKTKYSTRPRVKDVATLGVGNAKIPKASLVRQRTTGNIPGISTPTTPSLFSWGCILRSII